MITPEGRIPCVHGLVSDQIFSAHQFSLLTVRYISVVVKFFRREIGEIVRYSATVPCDRIYAGCESVSVRTYRVGALSISVSYAVVLSVAPRAVALTSGSDDARRLVDGRVFPLCQCQPESVDRHTLLIRLSLSDRRLRARSTLHCRHYRLEEPIMKIIIYGAKERLYAFGYNSAKSEPIWMKSGTVWAKCWGLALADFGCDPRSNNSLRGSLNFVFLVTRIMHDFADFTSEIFYDIWTQQRRSMRRWKLSEQNFENFTIRGLFSKNAKIAHKISRSCDFRPS